LLRAEAADACLAGGSLVTTGLENVPDGGVDASLDSAVETRYLPRGKSAWQFKAGDLAPAKCTKELGGAVYALEILRAGGKYRLVFGADINAGQVARRRTALEDVARAQGVVVGQDTIGVLNASHLAAWAGEHPSLAVSPLLGGISHVPVNFTTWSGSSGLAGSWVPNVSADAVAAEVDELVAGSAAAALHVQGFSGLGKTRAVLEALRGKPCEPLVAYVYAADALPPGLVYQLQRQERHTVLVVDECDPRTHEILAQQLPAGSKVRLITIGTQTGYRPRAEIHEIGPMDDQAMREVLRRNEPALPLEAALVVVSAAAGNVKLALLLAGDLARRPVPAASDLITAEIIESYVARSLPTGGGLLACAALALFTRLGFDAEVASELRAVADGLGFSVIDLKAAVEGLNRDGLLSRLGRFRAVTPHPLAVYLAARGWEQFGDQVTAALLPSLDDSMTARLLQRATDTGESVPLRPAVTQMLGPGGRFEKAGTAQDDSQGIILMYLAVLAPEIIADRLAATLVALTDQQREELASDRPEVTWTLEKLAWHAATFRQAAEGLLSLAVSASARRRQARAHSWTDLFGAVLPATSADPQVRTRYLVGASRDPDGRVRRLAVAAAARACSLHETVSMSAADQGGFLVAVRGRPATWGEAWEYYGAAMDTLADLANDAEPQVADEAVGALVAVIQPFLEKDHLRERLARAVTRMPAEGLTRARTQLEHLRALFGRADGDSAAGRMASLEALEAMLPAASPEEGFDALANASRWDFGYENELQRQLDEAALAIPAGQRTTHILQVVAARPAAAFELGKTLGAVAANDDTVLGELVTQAAAGNTEPLAGYLRYCVDNGAAEAFDDLLDSSRCAALDGAARLAVSVRGPRTARGWQRAARLVRAMPPTAGTRGLFGWHVGLTVRQVRQLLDDWMSRLGSQADYNAVVDFTAMTLLQSPPWKEGIDPVVAELAGRRASYPDVGNKDSDWVQLARRQLGRQPDQLLDTLLLLLDGGGYQPFEGTEEEDLLRETIEKVGPAGWRKTMDRLAVTPRMQAPFRSWLAGAADPDEASAWVGSDLKRARLLAQVATPGEDKVDPVGRFLLTSFGSDAEISSALSVAYVTGSSWESYSAQCQAQIDQLTGWVNDAGEPQPVKDWALRMITALTAERDRALQSEAEYEL
jgi:hypothetical protein